MKKRDSNTATSHALFDDQQDEFVGCGVGATRPIWWKVRGEITFMAFFVRRWLPAPGCG